jgi:hypothetical protein
MIHYILLRWLQHLRGRPVNFISREDEVDLMLLDHRQPFEKFVGEAQ